MNRSYIIWSLKFGQVYIFDLVLLLTQNNNLNYLQIKPYPLSQKILIVTPMKLIILFPKLIHTIIPSHNTIICNYNS
jgi:hypothetical protein